MRVLVVMALASPWSREVARNLHELGCEVHVVDFASAPNAAAYLDAEDDAQRREIAALDTFGISTHLLQSRWRSAIRYLATAGDLRRLAQRLRPQIVLTLYGGGFATLVWASGVRPYVVYVVGSDVLLAGPVARRVARRVLSGAATVLANGRYLAAKTTSLAPRARVEALYLGVPVHHFHPANQDINCTRVVCTRGFLPVYNNGCLVEALAQLEEGNPPLEVTFVSKGPLLDDVRALADRVLSPAQRGRVRFLGGVGGAALRAELARAQVYVSMSRSDGTSISLLEALASGLYPIVSDLPQNREWIEPEAQNGILVPVDDAQRLAAALVHASTDRTGRIAAATYNRRLAQERADGPTNMRVLVRRLAELARKDSEN
jgi:glycosyltransferase involved in cell wall biosynthesis